MSTADDVENEEARTCRGLIVGMIRRVGYRTLGEESKSALASHSHHKNSMGEEPKVEEKKEEAPKEGEKKEEVTPPEIVLRVDMHCEGCAKRVARSLRGFEGVEEVKTDCKSRTVVVKGKEADPVKVCDRVQKKTGRKVELISPLPKPPEEEKKEEAKDPPPEETKEEPKPITVILKIRMHCEACAQVLQRRIKKMEGVDSVVTDLSNDQVIVKGFVDPEKLVENVYRRTKKLASIVKEEEKKEEEKKAEEPEKKEEKTEEEKKEEDDKKEDAKKLEYWPPRYYIEYTNPPPQYAYPPPQTFSDENPNACSIM